MFAGTEVAQCNIWLRSQLASGERSRHALNDAEANSSAFRHAIRSLNPLFFSNSPDYLLLVTCY